LNECLPRIRHAKIGVQQAREAHFLCPCVFDLKAQGRPVVCGVW
jgi:hypothetical protein